MSIRNSENTEQLSAHARCLINEEIRLKQQENVAKDTKKDSLEQTSQEVRNVVRKSLAGTRRDLRAEWAELKGDGMQTPLAGIVAFVCVRREDKAMALRAALTAMGATVTLEWSMVVTHLIWQPGTDSQVRVDARRSNAHVVTPKWVITCAEKCQRVPERKFIAPCRPSDPLDPHALTRILKIAEKENIPLLDISEESASSRSSGKMKLRLSLSSKTSSEKSRDNSKDTSSELSKESPNLTSSSLKPSSETRINTALRKVHPELTPRNSSHARRKLFTDKEHTETESEEEEEEQQRQPRVKCKNPYAGQSQKAKKKIIKKKKATPTKNTQAKNKIIKSIDRMIVEKDHFKTTSPVKTLSTPKQKTVRFVLTGMSSDTRKEMLSKVRDLPVELQTSVTSRTSHVVCGEVSGGCRTFNALCGVVRGCWVVSEKWLHVSAESHSLIPELGYQVEEFRKVSTRCRIERSALQLRSYSFHIFSDLKVRVTEDVKQRAQICALLKLGGATLVHDKEEAADVVIIRPEDSFQENCVVSKWVSDSIIAGRPKSTKRYVL